LTKSKVQAAPIEARLGKVNMRVSLTALRAFEATARLGSMSQAAAELRVGLASVSRHISALQARLNVELLAREGRGVVLTPAGRAYFAEITAAFSSIATATEGLAWDSAARGPRLSLAVEPCLAQRWLLPRLRRFRDSEPGLTVQLVAAGPEPEAGAPPDVTLAWRRDLSRLEAGASVLAEPRVVALAAVGAPEPASLSALVRGATLVHQRTPEAWQRWLALSGHNGEPPRAGMLVPDKIWALNAAAGGLGLALACQVLAQPEIEAGRCRAVLGQGHLMGGYVAVQSTRPPAQEDGVAARFVDWVAAELRLAAA